MRAMQPVLMAYLCLPHGNKTALFQTSYFHVCVDGSDLYSQESEMETEEEVDILMSSDVYSATLSTKSITFSRAQTGWLFREDKTVGVNCCSYDCFYQDIINPTTTAGLYLAGEFLEF